MDEQMEFGAIRDQLLLLQAEGEALHAQGLQAQARGDREAVIALTERHVALTQEATALLTYVTQVREQRWGRA